MNNFLCIILDTKPQKAHGRFRFANDQDQLEVNRKTIFKKQ